MLLNLNEEHKKVLSSVLVVGFWKDKSVKDYLFRAWSQITQT